MVQRDTAGHYCQAEEHDGQGKRRKKANSEVITHGEVSFKARNRSSKQVAFIKTSVLSEFPSVKGS
jgi:hypothetical protein